LKGEAGRADLERLLREAAFEVTSLTPQQAQITLDAFRRFRKGRHPAGLNIGDGFSYALATATGEPLLFRGDDFGKRTYRQLCLPKPLDRPYTAFCECHLAVVCSLSSITLP